MKKVKSDEFLTEAEELFDSYIDEAEVLVDLSRY